MHVVLDLGRPDRRHPSSAEAASHSVLSSRSASTTVKGSAEASQAATQSVAADVLADVKFASVQLREGVDTVILGSEGLW